jgi:signal recognition particle subunit SRP54
MMSMMQGVAKMKNQMAAANLDEKLLTRQKAIIDSMTPGERRKPDVLKASRKKRIAAGSGTKVEEINRLLKMHRQMADMMKAVGSGKRGALGGLGQMLGMGGGGPSPEMLRQMAEKMPGGLPGAGGMPANIPGLAGGLPGLGGKLPGLGGLPGLGAPKDSKKK